MSTILILTPVIVSSWPAISAAAAGAAAALGFTARHAVQEMRRQQKEETVEKVELELAGSEVLAQSLATDQQIVLTKGAVQMVVERDARGQCRVCASGPGLSNQQLQETAEQFTQKLTQCFIYDKVVRELKNKSFQVVNEEVLPDQSIRIHVRRWVD
jgi:ABC-type transporter MlaC component